MTEELPPIPSWVDHLEYGTHPFSPSCMTGTPAEGVMAGKDRMAWLAIDWCGNVVGVEEADWCALPEGFDPETQTLRVTRDDGFVVTFIKTPVPA